MKKLFLSVIAFVWTLCSASGAIGTPLLQLDIVDSAWYDTSNETISTGAKHFDLIALLNTAGRGQHLGDLGHHYFSLVASSNAPASFKIDGSGVSLSSGDVPSDLPPHEELGSFGYQLDFLFDPNNTTPDYNTQDNPGGFGGFDPDGSLLFKSFNIDLTGLDPFTPIHFDLYTHLEKKNDGGRGNIAFAPFSHDASAVPEPATMLLLGTGLAGLAGTRIRKRFKNSL